MTHSPCPPALRKAHSHNCSVCNERAQEDSTRQVGFWDGNEMQYCRHSFLPSLLRLLPVPVVLVIVGVVNSFMPSVATFHPPSAVTRNMLSTSLPRSLFVGGLTAFQVSTTGSPRQIVVRSAVLRSRHSVKTGLGCGFSSGHPQLSASHEEPRPTSTWLAGGISRITIRGIGTAGVRQHAIASNAVGSRRMWGGSLLAAAGEREGARTSRRDMSAITYGSAIRALHRRDSGSASTRHATNVGSSHDTYSSTDASKCLPSGTQDDTNGAPSTTVSSSTQDTIFALSTGISGPAGVAVIRISGPGSGSVLETLTTFGTPTTADPDPRAGDKSGQSSNTSKSILPAPRRAVVRRLYDPNGGELLDEALVLWMPAPRSFTGEDTVELHTHGSRAVINGVLDALGGMASLGVRLAERGEFTQRAYGNGRMDLTGVEGLADLIAADTAAQRKQALKQMGGALRDMYESWRTELKGCLAHAEAVIDFGDDEEDVGGDAAFAAIQPRVSTLAAEIDAHLRDGGRGEIVRSGVRVAIVGPPNAGKSSLLNLLAARPAAIVSPVAGTTRDVVEVQMDIAGLPVTMSDTAGLREATEDEIEKEGMRRARGAVESAHLAIFVVDSTDASGAGELLRRLREEAKAAAIAEDERWTTEGGERWGGIGGERSGSAGALDDVIIVANKADLSWGETAHVVDGDSLQELIAASFSKTEENSTDGATNSGANGQRAGRLWRVSCKTKEGLDGFMGHLEAEVQSRFQGAGEDESPLITRRRHRQHVEGCLEALRASQAPHLPLDLAAEELRIASCELGRITGAVGVEELLDVIFRDFCIGK